MTAIKTANIVEGNLAQEPKYFPEGQYVARIVFRIRHTDRRLNPQTNQWEDGRTTAVDVNFYGPAAERYAQTLQQQPDVFAKGTAVVAWGELSDRPDTWTDRDGNPQATPVINGTRIIPNQLVNQRRASRQQANSTSLSQYTNAAPEQGPVGGATGAGLNHHERQPGSSTTATPSIQKGTWKWNASKPST